MWRLIFQNFYLLNFFLFWCPLFWLLWRTCSNAMWLLWTLSPSKSKNRVSRLLGFLNVTECGGYQTTTPQGNLRIAEGD